MLGYFGDLLVAIIGIAVGVVDADAEDFFGRAHRRQKFQFGEREIRAHAAHRVAGGGEAVLRAQQVEHAGKLRLEPRHQIDHALTHHGTEAFPAAHPVACKFHADFQALRCAQTSGMELAAVRRYAARISGEPAM